jgi:hypothetical protein
MSAGFLNAPSLGRKLDGNGMADWIVGLWSAAWRGPEPLFGRMEERLVIGKRE